MGFEAWEAFAAGPLRLPINGKTYAVPQMSAKVGIELAAGKISVPKGKSALESYRPLLTSVIFDRMLADGVTPQAIQRAALTVYNDYLLGREAAEAFWKLGSIPEALAAQAAASANGTAPQKKTRTGAASSTPARGTGSSTRGKTTTTTANRSRGRGSSRSGS